MEFGRQRLGADLEWRTCLGPCSLAQDRQQGCLASRLAQSETLSKTCRCTPAVTVRFLSIFWLCLCVLRAFLWKAREGGGLLPRHDSTLPTSVHCRVLS